MLISFNRIRISLFELKLSSDFIRVSNIFTISLEILFLPWYLYYTSPVFIFLSFLLSFLYILFLLRRRTASVIKLSTDNVRSRIKPWCCCCLLLLLFYPHFLFGRPLLFSTVFKLATVCIHVATSHSFFASHLFPTFYPLTLFCIYLFLFIFFFVVSLYILFPFPSTIFVITRLPNLY